ncbi:autotransporter-associated N-terminal domain-containing protein, partial [Fusobacterium hwasookii]
MKNHLASIEVSLRSIAKRYKTVKFSIGVAILFLMLGVGAFSEEINETQANETPTREEIASSRENLKNSIGNLQSKIDSAREENSKSLKGLKLELIQLMEQGDQVVKSPWASWQFGANYMYSKWNGTYKGIGDKAEKYPFEGVFVRGNWWENNVSPNSKTYERLEKSSNPNSSLSNRRQNLNYGLVNTVPVVDKGVPFIIEPVININTPPLPNLNINPVAINPTVAFSIPDVETVVFTPTKLPDIKPNVFNPPALDEVSIGFSQDMVGAQFYLEPNVIVNNANAAANTSGTTVTINDDGFSVNNPFTWEGKKGNMGRDGSGTVAGTWTFDQVDPQPGQTYTDARSGSIVNNANSAYLGYRGYVNYRTGTPVSPQTVFSFTQYQQQDNLKYGQAIDTTITGEWTLINNTTNPHNRGAGGPYKPPTNTVRFMSVNGTTVYSYYDPLNVTFNGTLNLYGRSKENSLSTGKPHMTVGIEQQAAGAKQSTFVNIGVINLEKGDAKNSTQYGRYLIGMTSMVEDYAQYQPTTGNSVGQRGTTPYPKIIYKPWETAMINKGTINVKSIDSIGMDFSEFNFNKEANLGGNATKKKAWDNKGSLNVYMKVGNINVSSTDPGIYQEVSGSYGIRVPNLFAPGVSENLDATRRNEDTRAIYYDETVIDGEGGQITLTGSHNTGVSISKIIRGSGLHTIANPYTKTETITTTEGSQDVYEGHISVYDYQTGKGADGNGLGGKTTDRANLDNTGRTLDDLIGNIYNLNIVVDGKENVGFLRKSDYMKGNYDADIQTLAQKDFVIKDSHVASIDFANNTDGGVLFRTDRYGIDLAKNLTVNPGDAYIGDTDPNKDESEWLNKRFNIVMLANGGENHADTVVPKVRNSGKITVSAGGRNIIGLMAYKGAKAVSDEDITITNSDNSIGMVLTGTNTSNKISSGTSSKKISVTGKNATGIYNNGSDYEMTAGSISVNGNKAIAVYASKANNRQAITKLGAGTISASGDGSIGLYADGGSDIELNGTTINIGDKGLFFFGKAENSDEAQLKLTGNATVNVASGGTAFYVKKSNSGSPLGSIRHAGSTGTLTVNLANGSTLMVAEGNGGTASPERISSLSSVGSSSVTGINIVGTAGQYVPYKALRVPLLVDRNSNFDSAADTYLNSEFSSSSVTIDTGVTVSGSGALTSPTKLVKKSKVAIAQKNTNST